jgi:GNAT superfamily N-acetyltransferase
LDALAVRPARADDEAAWREMWKGYCDFYEEVVEEPVTAATWERLLDPDWPMGALVAVDGDELVGFANYVVHPRTWSREPVCYLEDLFVRPAARGRGAGRALIERLLELGRAQGWVHVYWHTRRDNATARALYDSFRPADDFVRYVVGRD